MTRPSIMLVAGLALAAGCGTGPDAAAPDGDGALPALAPLAAPGVRAALVSDSATELVLRIDALPDAPGSVQGTLRFDPADFEVVEVRPITGAYAVANSSAVGDGLLRFAAFGTERLPDAELFAIRIRPRRQLSQVEVSLQLEAAGTPEGEAVAGPGLVATSRIYRRAP
jgi:hypothetical protein